MMPIVWPSGGAVAIAACPTTPEPPVRLMTLKGCFRSFSSTAATMRAVASVPPPAPHGQMTVTGRPGQVCARAGRSPSAATAPAAPPIRTSRRVDLLMTMSSLMCPLPPGYRNQGRVLRPPTRTARTWSQPVAAPPHLGDDAAVVEIGLALAHAGGKDVLVDFEQRQALTVLARLVEHEMDVLERLAHAPFRREFTRNHFWPLGRHDL